MCLDAGASDAKVGPLPYGNPFPTSWGEWLSVGVHGSLPDGSPVGAGVSVSFLRAKAGAGPIVPRGPVQDLRINGESAFDVLTGVTTTPTISWTAPAVGVPTLYEVGVGPGGVGALFTTANTSMTLPPCNLVAGATYFVSVSAIVTNVDGSSHPYRIADEYHEAYVISNYITP